MLPIDDFLAILLTLVFGVGDILLYETFLIIIFRGFYLFMLKREVCSIFGLFLVFDSFIVM